MNLYAKWTSQIPVVLSIASLLAMAAGSRAMAEEQVRSEIVKFHDLNVNTSDGVQTLYRRIHAAAKRVCSQTDPILQYGTGACAKKAESQAIEKVNLPQLTAYYKMKAGVQTGPLVAAR